MSENMGGGDGVKKFIPESVSRDVVEPEKQVEKIELTDILSPEEIIALINQQKQEPLNNVNEPGYGGFEMLSPEEIDKLLNGVDLDSEQEIDELRRELRVEEQPKVEEKDEKRYNGGMKEGQSTSNAFAERFAKSAEAKIEADKLRNTHENAVDLVQNNVDFFGSTDEEKKSEIATRILGRFNRTPPYADFNSIVEASMDASRNTRIAFGDIDSLAESVRIAMDMSVLGDDLVTDSLTAEDIDENLPKELKGIGKRIKEKRLTDGAEDELLEINKIIEDNNLFTTQDKAVRGEVYKEWGEKVLDLPESSYIRRYVEVARSVFKDLGVNNNLDEDAVAAAIQSQIPDRESGEARGRSWEISPEYAAMGMKFMDDIRWQTYTPPEWFKNLKPRGKETADQLQSRIEYMMMINEGANWTSKVGPDLDKIRENPLYKSFDGEKFKILFNEDFKLVMSKLLNDLCEPYTDQNGKTCMRYKEIIKDGVRIIDLKVNEKLVGIRNYKEEMATFLAEQNDFWEKDKKGNFVLDEKGEKIPDYMNKMNAYTAWNLFYMFGDSSLADRMRVLPTYGGIINDGIRSLNIEKKALAKWKVEKGGVASGDTVFGAEWYTSFGPYIQKVMKIEQDLGHDIPVLDDKGKQKIDEYGRLLYNRVSKAIDGDKTIREKILDGTLPILANKTCYGFFDFVSGNRDLLKPNGEEFETKEGETLGTLLRGYVNFDNVKVTKNPNKDFNFTKKQVDFLNWYRDQQESAAFIFNCVNGKEDVRDVDKFVRKIRTLFGMVDDITINKERTFSYTTRPDLWANIILGSFGIDMSRVSSDHIRLKTQPYKNEEGEMVEPAYNLFVESFLTDTMGLSNSDVNLSEVMKYMGVSLKNNENPKALGVSIRNNKEWMAEKRRTDALLKKQDKAFNYGNKGVKIANGSDYENSKKLKEINFEFSKITGNFKNYDAEMIYRDLARAIKSGEIEIAVKLLTRFEEKNQ